MTHIRRMLRFPLLPALFAGALVMAGSAGATAASTVAAGAAQPAVSSPALGRHLVESLPGLHGAHAITAYTSQNWDGYFATSSSESTDFTAVSAEWTQPKVTCNTEDEYAGF